ncbi:hypothetical protein [Pyxidicoccus caerfyrddinensis]
MTSGASVVMVPSWLRGPSTRRDLPGASSPASRISRRQRAFDVRTP